MASWILLATSFADANWHVLPLALVVSLVYSATRHEAAGEILQHAVRFFIMIMSFVIVVFVVLFLLSLRL